MRILVYTFLLILILPSSNGFTQEYTTWGLPDGAKTRLGKGQITTIAFSPDGSQLAVASTVGIWIYDAHTGKELALLPGYREGFTTSVQSALGGHFMIHTLVFSPNGKLLASASMDDTIRIFDVSTYTEHYTLYKNEAAIVNNNFGRPRFTDLAFSADGQTLTVLERAPKYKIKMWDVNSGTLLSDISGRISGDPLVEDEPVSPVERKSDNPFVALALSPDGTTFAAKKLKITFVDGIPETEIAFGNVRTGELEPPLMRIRLNPPKRVPNQAAGSAHTIRKLIFSPDGTTLAGITTTTKRSNQNSKRTQHIKIQFWYVSTGREVSTVIPQQAENHRQLPFLAFSSDSRTFATVNWRSAVAQLWDVNTGNLISTITIPSTEPASSWHTRSIGALTFHPTRKALAVAANEREDGGNSSLQLWGVSTGKLISTLTEHPMLYPFAANEKTILCFNANNFQLRDTNTGKILRNLKKTWTNLFKHLQKVDNVEAFAVLSDNTTFAIGGADGLLELWNMQAGERLLTLKGHTDQITALALTADNTILASGSQDKSIRLWDTRTGAKLLTLTGHKNSGKKQIFSNAPTRLSAELVNNLVFSSDSKMLASSSEHGTIWLWDLSTGNLLKTLTGHEAAADTLLAGTGLSKIGMAFSPDNKLFASGGRNGQVILSDMSANPNHLSLNGHTWSVKTLTFSPDSKLLASGSKDRTIRLWNTQTGTEIAILRGHSNEIYKLKFSVDGSTLVSGSTDGTILLWDRDRIVDMDQ